MKKLLSIVLAALILFSVFSTGAFAMEEKEYVELKSTVDIPFIHIRGDGETLYYPDGVTPVKTYKNILESTGGEEEEGEDNPVVEAIVNIATPFLIQGLGTGNFQPYYDALRKEIGDMFADSLLDGDGNSWNGVDIGKAAKRSMENKLSTNYNGAYGFLSYAFFYDWRLDPYENADKLDKYIDKVIEKTGKPKVGIMGQCVGSSVAAAYVERYGMDKLQGVCFDFSTVNGSEPMGESISGQFHIDPVAVNRFLKDCNGFGLFSVDEIITATVDYIDKSGLYFLLTEPFKKTLYPVIVEGVTSALALSTMYTYPCYWAAVPKENYDDALNYVFGKEGSEKRKEYKGLIEKIENYHNNVSLHLADIYQEIADNGNLNIVCKYGSQLVPICKSADMVGDQFVSVTRSSFGATTSTVYDTLSDEYIAKRVAENKGKYISPDKQIDASTCMFPDYTFFVKGASHSTVTVFETYLSMALATGSRQLTVDDFDCSQYIVVPDLDFGTDSSELFYEAMTAENCHTENWIADKTKDKPDTLIGKIKAFWESAKHFFSLLFDLLKNSK